MDAEVFGELTFVIKVKSCLKIYVWRCYSTNCYFITNTYELFVGSSSYNLRETNYFGSEYTLIGDED